MRAQPAAEIHETHTGVVVLIGDRAYKVKKPVVTDFLDFSTPERRERVCADEVVLNRRLAPDSYLGVAHLSDPEGGPAEPVIVMRRHPDSCRLAAMVTRDEPVRQHLSAIADVLARFHAGAARSGAIDVAGTVATVTTRWQENLTELRRYTGTVVSSDRLSEVQRLAMQFIAGRPVLFAQRISDRRIVDGHGDLLADDVFCLPDGPELLDCLEFDEHLRHVDCIDDAAFLAMDLEFLGRNDLSEFFTDEYRHRADDQAPASLTHFYMAYRAVVRAKVECIRADQGRRSAAADAQTHLDLALEHLRAGTVKLVLVGGGPGTGKTTLARTLAPRLGAQVISTDDVRRELLESGALDGSVGIVDAGLYRPDKVSAVYDTVLHRASALLATGRSVILDGTWRDPSHRERAHDLAEQMSCPMVELACTVPLDIAEARIAGRRDTTSDATPRIAEALSNGEGTWSGAHPIDTSGTLVDSVAEAQERCCLAI